jgi:hypothetical protein
MSNGKPFMISSLNSPCYKCSERHNLCHDNCERYKEYLEDLKKRNQYLKDMKNNPHVQNLAENDNKLRKGRFEYNRCRRWN